MIRRSLISLMILMLWSVCGHGQESGYTEEETQLIRAMLWKQEEIEKQQTREAEKREKREPEPQREVNTITQGETTLNKNGEGWVLEFDGDAATESTVESSTAGSVSSTTAAGVSGVELIVGGQGKDGLAKRRNLPVIE